MRFALLLFVFVLATPVFAQSLVVPNLGLLLFESEAVEGVSAEATVPRSRSVGAAFGLSIVLPGLGHRYAAGGWGRTATVHALADAGLWIALLDAGARLGNAETGFETLAVVGADAQIEGQGRGFFLNLSRHRSSEEYVEQLLRDRAWNELETAQLPENQWEWASEEDFQQYRALREDAESLRRRRPVYAALLAGNRLLSGIGALRAARRVNRTEATLSLGMPQPGADTPTVNLSVRF